MVWNGEEERKYYKLDYEEVKSNVSQGKEIRLEEKEDARRRKEISHT